MIPMRTGIFFMAAMPLLHLCAASSHPRVLWIQHRTASTVWKADSSTDPILSIVPGMATTEERISTVETRIANLETWAGAGQIEVLLAGMRGVRRDMTVMRRVQNRQSQQLDRLTGDVAALKGDVTALKSDVAEILRRLPDPPASG